jgi:hypothetical protein
MPKTYDGMFVEYWYGANRHTAKNSGAKKLPFFTQIIPKDFSSMSSLKEIFDPSGYPALVKNVVTADQDKIVDIMSKGNRGKNMRMFNYENITIPHFSPSCSNLRASVIESFDNFAESHLYTKSANNHSFLYAGFEAITDAATIRDVIGLDSEQLGDYRLNNLFTSNFPREIFTAALHCAPIDSLSIQLIGTKTWYFVSPQSLAELPSIPIPTSFVLPMTDDELLEKISNVYVVKQRPGDALYFGPNWCHAVSTAEGPNLMVNIRYNNLDLVKRGPLRLALKLLHRKYSGRQMGGLPQDNTHLFPILYDALTNFYDDCGASPQFEKIWKEVQKW